MDEQSPVLEIVAGEHGSPVFQICGLGMCTRHQSFMKCKRMWEALLVAKGLHPDQFPVLASYQAAVRLDDADGQA